MRRSLAVPKNFRATAANMPEILSRPLPISPPSLQTQPGILQHIHIAELFWTGQAAAANARTSGAAGSREIGAGQTVVNRPAIGLPQSRPGCCLEAFDRLPIGPDCANVAPGRAGTSACAGPKRIFPMIFRSYPAATGVSRPLVLRGVALAA